MRIPFRARSRSMAVDMTPAVGVLFLLIFLFLVASILSQGATVPLDLPIATSGESAGSTGGPLTTLDVRPDGSVSLAGESVAVENLVERLAQLRRESGDDVGIRIRLDRELPYAAFEPALVACAQAEIGNVQLAVLRAEDTR